MGVKYQIAEFANRILRPLGASLVSYRDGVEKPWDHAFRDWLRKAQAEGRDPNEIGDQDWWDDPLDVALQDHYLPHITPQSVVLELGPGTGRLTRRIISHCREMILVDYSRMVCDFLRTYLRGKGSFRVHQIDRPLMPMVPGESVDTALANGVFEHLDPEEVLWFLKEFARVLRPGGAAAFNFDNIMNEEGIACLEKRSDVPGRRCPFRFYHPEMMSALAQAAGFAVTRVCAEHGRFAYIELRKPAPAPGTGNAPQHESSGP